MRKIEIYTKKLLSILRKGKIIIKEKKIIHFKLFLIILFPFFSWFFILIVLQHNYKNFNELALGQDNIFLNKMVLENKILCNSFDDIEDCIKYLKQYKKKIIWIGNSQLHAVNQPDSNAKLASYLVSETLQKKEIAIVTFSAPNINFQEYLAVFNYVTNKVNIDYIILSLCFDDTREDNVRKDLVEARLDSTSKNLFNVKSFETKIFRNFSSIEKNINFFFQERFQWNTTRQQAQGYTFEILYKLRNYIFNIKPSTVRGIIKPIYDKNIHALETILRISQSKKIQTITYVVPIRMTKLPYYEEEYILFKTDVLNLSKKYNSDFYNLEKIVPNSFWGQKKSTTISNEDEIDFMHFRQEGHIILSKYIIQMLTKYF